MTDGLFADGFPSPLATITVGRRVSIRLRYPKFRYDRLRGAVFVKVHVGYPTLAKVA